MTWCLFYQVFDAQDLEQLKKDADKFEFDLDREAAAKGLRPNEVLLYNARELTGSNSNRWPVVKKSKRTIKDGDIVSVHFNIIPYAYIPATKKCGLSLQPVAVTYFKSTSAFQPGMEVPSAETNFDGYF